MLEHERIRKDACGCCRDVVTGLAVYLCRAHRDEQANELYRVDEESIKEGG